RATEIRDLPFYPWKSAEEFEIVNFLSVEGLSQGAIDRFLRLIYVSKRPFSFSTARQMYERIGRYMEAGPEWHVVDVPVPEFPSLVLPLFYRNPVDCAKYLYENPAF
ncbi:hypothetical protein DL93DRAFT_2038892, partial [Clavulina sp. PMI_390]